MKYRNRISGKEISLGGYNDLSFLGRLFYKKFDETIILNGGEIKMDSDLYVRTKPIDPYYTNSSRSDYKKPAPYKETRRYSDYKDDNLVDDIITGIAVASVLDNVFSSDDSSSSFDSSSSNDSVDYGGGDFGGGGAGDDY